MNKKTKIAIGIALGGAAAYAIYLMSKKSSLANSMVNTNPIDVNPVKNQCMLPNISCPNNPAVCYNPYMIYLVNPCKLV